jgi:plasmid stabilization system protein ParE
MTIRLTPAAIDKLSEIERTLRREGIRARQASASEIVEALINGADTVSLAEFLKDGGR